MRSSRRKFLRSLGVAGALAGTGGLCQPLLRQVTAQGTPPRRFVFVVEGNGTEPVLLLSRAARAALEAQSGGSIGAARSFRSHYPRDRNLVIENSDLATAKGLPELAGIEHKAAVILGMPNRIAGGGHQTGYSALSCSQNMTSPIHATIDGYLAILPAVRQSAPFEALRLGVAPGRARIRYGTYAAADLRPAGAIVDPSAAFQKVFGFIAEGAGARAFRRRGQLLDFARREVERVRTSFGSNSLERQKVEAYIQAIENLVGSDAQLLAEYQEAARRYKPAGPAESDLYASTAPLHRLQAQFDIATAALQGGLTNVVALDAATNNGALGLRHHSLSHLYPHGTVVGGHTMRHSAEAGDETWVAILHEISKQYMSMTARLAKTLAETPEPQADGSMLDHTVIVYVPDNGERHHSQAYEWPALVIGGQALGLRTDGRTIIYARDRPHRRGLSNLYNTLGYAAGDELDDFGLEGSYRYAPGPLAELYG